MEHDLSRSSELCAILSDKSGKLLKDLRERMRVQHCDEILEFIIAVEKTRKYSMVSVFSCRSSSLLLLILLHFFSDSCLT
ncbi:MAG: hypothetical protein MHMPM18_003441 [Marteilia pararefringens]